MKQSSGYSRSIFTPLSFTFEYLCTRAKPGHSKGACINKMVIIFNFQFKKKFLKMRAKTRSVN